jgi:hypothetical protein
MEVRGSEIRRARLLVMRETAETAETAGTVRGLEGVRESRMAKESRVGGTAVDGRITIKASGVGNIPPTMGEIAVGRAGAAYLLDQRA